MSILLETLVYMLTDGRWHMTAYRFVTGMRRGLSTTKRYRVLSPAQTVGFAPVLSCRAAVAVPFSHSHHSALRSGLSAVCISSAPE